MATANDIRKEFTTERPYSDGRSGTYLYFDRDAAVEKYGEDRINQMVWEGSRGMLAATN